MTEPDADAAPEPDASAAAAGSADDDQPAHPRPSRPGAGIFTIEGRRAPGLFVVGWLATLVGLGLVVVGVLSGPGPATVILLLAGVALTSLGLVAGAGSQAIERAARGTFGYVGPSPFLVFAATVALTILFGALLGVVFQTAGLATDSPLATLASLVLTAAVYLGLVRLLVVGTGSLSWAEMGVRRPGPDSASNLLYGLAFALPLLVITGLLGQFLAQFLALPESPLPPGGDLVGGLINLVSAAIIAPIAEEIFFRGFSTTAWARSLGERSAIVRGGLFFAFAHILAIGGDSFGQAAEQALFAFLVRLPIAFALGWIFLRRRSLYASIGLHAGFNGVPALLLLFGLGGS